MSAWNYRRYRWSRILSNTKTLPVVRRCTYPSIHFFVSRSRSVARRVRVQAFVCGVCAMCVLVCVVVVRCACNVVCVLCVWCVICVVCDMCGVCECVVSCVMRVLCVVARVCWECVCVCGIGVLCFDVVVCWAVSLCVVLACVLGCVVCRGDVCVSSCLAPKTLPCVRSKRSRVYFQNARVTKDTGVLNVHTRPFSTYTWERLSPFLVSPSLFFSCLSLSFSSLSVTMALCRCTRKRFEPTHGDVLNLHTEEGEGGAGLSSLFLLLPLFRRSLPFLLLSLSLFLVLSLCSSLFLSLLVSLFHIFLSSQLSVFLFSMTMTMIVRPVGSLCTHSSDLPWGPECEGCGQFPVRRLCSYHARNNCPGIPVQASCQLEWSGPVSVLEMGDVLWCVWWCLVVLVCGSMWWYVLFCRLRQCWRRCVGCCAVVTVQKKERRLEFQKMSRERIHPHHGFNQFEKIKPH